MTRTKNGMRPAPVPPAETPEAQRGDEAPTDMAMTIPIPLPGGRRQVVLTTPTMSEDDWQYLMTVLEAMRPGLVRSGE